jgi:hypothetical protein
MYLVVVVVTDRVVVPDDFSTGFVAQLVVTYDIVVDVALTVLTNVV